jgi:hypothetical protein
MSAPKDRWLDREAGPVVRPYAVTKGRTAPASGSYVGLIDLVVAVADPHPRAGLRLGREHQRILRGCHQPIAVVDLASDIDLPVGVVRVLLGDLSQCGALEVVSTPRGATTNERILRDVLHGLQAL